MTIENMENGKSPEEGMKKFKVGIEMEAYDKEGNEVEGSNLWEEVETEASNEQEAQEKAIAEFYKRVDEKRKPNGYSEAREVGKPKDEPPFQGVKLGQ